MAEEMLGQVWDRVGSASKARCLLLLRGFLQRARRCLSGPSQWHTGGGRWRSADGTTAASEKRVIDRRTGSEEEEEESDRVIEGSRPDWTGLRCRGRRHLDRGGCHRFSRVFIHKHK